MAGVQLPVRDPARLLELPLRLEGLPERIVGDVGGPRGRVDGEDEMRVRPPTDVLVTVLDFVRSAALLSVLALALPNRGSGEPLRYLCFPESAAKGEW